MRDFPSAAFDRWLTTDPNEPTEADESFFEEWQERCQCDVDHPDDCKCDALDDYCFECNVWLGQGDCRCTMEDKAYDSAVDDGRYD